jgi:hypothetical protein
MPIIPERAFTRADHDEGFSMKRFLFLRRNEIAVLIIISLFVSGAGPASAREKGSKSFMDLPVTRDLRPKFVLFSWRGKAGVQHFAVVSKVNGNEDHRFIDNFDVRRSSGMDMPTLRTTLAKLPRGCLLTWMKDAPHKLDYADSQSLQEIKKLASRLHIDLQFNEMTYESPDV